MRKNRRSTASRNASKGKSKPKKRVPERVGKYRPAYRCQICGTLFHDDDIVLEMTEKEAKEYVKDVVASKNRNTMGTIQFYTYHKCNDSNPNYKDRHAIAQLAGVVEYNEEEC